MRLGLGLYLAPIPRPSSEQFVFYVRLYIRNSELQEHGFKNSTSP